MKRVTNSSCRHFNPGSALMLELVATVLLVMTLLLGAGLTQRRLWLIAEISPPLRHSSIAIAETPFNTRVQPRDPHSDREDRLLALLERMNVRMDNIATQSSSREFVDALNRLGQQMLQATETMATTRAREAEEQTLNRNVLLGLQDHIEKLETLVGGPAPLPSPPPLATQALQPPLPPTDPAGVQSPEEFFSRLRAFLTRAQLKIHVNSEQATLLLPSNLDFDRGSPVPGPRQRRALSALAQGLARILPCHVAHPPAGAFSCNEHSGRVRIDAIHIRGLAAFAHPGEPRYYFNWKLATSRAFHVLQTLVTAAPELLIMKNGRGQSLFQIEGHVASSRKEQGNLQPDLRFFFETTDNGDGGTVSSATGKTEPHP
ncbi:MAG: hypothetical protein HQL73_01575 [Magnetococcales bacterium]|nr:hypothetical protein [Magnetococcales bacterium]